MTSPLSVALIGLDSSHTNAFAKRMNDPACPDHQKIPELHAQSCLRFESAFQDKEGLDQRQQELESWGVRVTEDFGEVVANCDVIMLELNDPVMHLEYFERVAGLGKPVFLDKPLADTLDNGRRITSLAEANGVRLWSSSSLRFVRGLKEASQAVPRPDLCNVYGPLGKAASGSDVVWYGVHTFEMMTAAMGLGAKTLYARRDEKGIITTIVYDDGRRAVVELNDGAFFYGGRLQSSDKVSVFQVGASDTLYDNLLARVRDFFLGDDAPVPLEETLEIQAILNGVECSLEEGVEVRIAEA